MSDFLQSLSKPSVIFQTHPISDVSSFHNSRSKSNLPHAWLHSCHSKHSSDLQQSKTRRSLDGLHNRWIKWICVLTTEINTFYYRHYRDKAMKEWLLKLASIFKFYISCINIKCRFYTILESTTVVQTIVLYVMQLLSVDFIALLAFRKDFSTRERFALLLWIQLGCFRGIYTRTYTVKSARSWGIK